MTYATLSLLPKRDGRARAGHPWIYSNEIDMETAAKAQLTSLPAGSLVNVLDSAAGKLGTYMFNPKTLIALRRLSSSMGATPDTKWFGERLRQALRRREAMFTEPYYRLVHSEGDDLPGLVVDRFGPTLVVQATTAGMEALKAPLAKALLAIEGVEGLVWRMDAPARALEGLPTGHDVEIMGAVPEGMVEARENGLAFVADVRGGQKTGWFYDQRANRAFVANLAKGQAVLDVCSHTGGFGLTALAKGAEHATFVDSSGPALDAAAASARQQGVGERCTMVEGDMFEALETMAAGSQRFGVVVCDPPAFIKNAKTIPQGLKGYEKMAKLAAATVSGGGYLTLCSCSHHAAPEEFVDACVRGIRRGGRSGRVLRLGFADADHPQHLLLAENGYLKCLTVQLD